MYVEIRGGGEKICKLNSLSFLLWERSSSLSFRNYSAATLLYCSSQYCSGRTRSRLSLFTPAEY